MRLIDFARLHWPWRVLFRVLSLSWKLLGSRGPRHHRSSGPALQALASETPDTASKLLPLVTLPILLVARSRCPDPDSNLHRTTYPSPPLRSAQAVSGGPIHSAWRRSTRLQDHGKLLQNSHSRWRSSSRRSQRTPGPAVRATGTKRPDRSCGHWLGLGLGNGRNLPLCFHAAPRSARCSNDAAPLARSVGSQDRVVARVRRGGHVRPRLAVFRPRYHSCHCRGRRCGWCRGNHQIVPLFRARTALGSAVAALMALMTNRRPARNNQIMAVMQSSRQLGDEFMPFWL